MIRALDPAKYIENQKKQNNHPDLQILLQNVNKLEGDSTPQSLRNHSLGESNFFLLFLFLCLHRLVLSLSVDPACLAEIWGLCTAPDQARYLLDHGLLDVLDKIFIEIDDFSDQSSLSSSLTRLLRMHYCDLCVLERIPHCSFLCHFSSEVLLGILANLAAIDDPIALRIATHPRIAPAVIRLLVPSDPDILIQVFRFFLPLAFAL